jgi:hypothetical protein
MSSMSITISPYHMSHASIPISESKWKSKPAKLTESESQTPQNAKTARDIQQNDGVFHDRGNAMLVNTKVEGVK